MLVSNSPFLLASYKALGSPVSSAGLLQEGLTWHHYIKPAFLRGEKQLGTPPTSLLSYFKHKIWVHAVLGAPSALILPAPGTHKSRGAFLRMKHLVQSQQQLGKTLTLVFISVPRERHPQAERAVSPKPAVHTEQPFQLCCTGHPRAGLGLKTHSLIPLSWERLPRGLMGPEQPSPPVQGKNSWFEGNL